MQQLFYAEEAMVACRQLRLGIPVSYSGNTTLASIPYYFYICTVMEMNKDFQDVTLILIMTPAIIRICNVQVCLLFSICSYILLCKYF